MDEKFNALLIVKINIFDKSDKSPSKMSEEKPILERQTSESLKIPERRVVVKDASELPNSYSVTPGGTMFSTTPGGMYDYNCELSFLINAHDPWLYYCLSIGSR